MISSAPISRLPDPYALELNQRVWDDAPYGQMSSDGQQVFLLWKLASDLQQMSTRVLPFGRQSARRIASKRTSWSRWISGRGQVAVDRGGRGRHGRAEVGRRVLSRAPAALDGPTVCAGGNQQRDPAGRARCGHRPAAVGPATGPGGSAGNLRTIPTRRAAGASPSFSDGILVCPTSAGAVVAVDISTRSLLWGYQYPHVAAARRSGLSVYPDADAAARRAVGRRHRDDRRRARAGDPRGIGPTALPGPAHRQAGLGSAAAQRPAVHSLRRRMARR